MFTGRVWIWRSVTAWAISDLVVSISGDSPVTVTISSIERIPSVKSRLAS